MTATPRVPMVKVRVTESGNQHLWQGTGSPDLAGYWSTSLTLNMWFSWDCSQLASLCLHVGPAKIKYLQENTWKHPFLILIFFWSCFKAYLSQKYITNILVRWQKTFKVWDRLRIAGCLVFLLLTHCPKPLLVLLLGGTLWGKDYHCKLSDATNKQAKNNTDNKLCITFGTSWVPLSTLLLEIEKPGKDFHYNRKFLQIKLVGNHWGIKTSCWSNLANIKLQNENKMEGWESFFFLDFLFYFSRNDISQ